MLVLLPPSEGKADGGDGAPVRLPSLALAGELTATRERVLHALTALCRDDPEGARAALGMSEGLRPEIARNAALESAPALPAAELYTGVLYDSLGLATLAPAARALADRSLLVFSGLWGAVRPGDRIPRYRCSMSARLPGVGGLAAAWRPAMEAALPAAAGRRLVLDLRSSAYAAAWKPRGAVAGHTATVRVLHERVVDGAVRRSVVSHFNKATKGRLVRALLTAGAEPKSPADLVAALRELGFTVEPDEPAAGSGRPWQLDVVVTEV